MTRRPQCDLRELSVFEERMSEILTSEPRTGLPSQPTRLLDYVYIGCQAHAECLKTLQRTKITHVLNCAGYKGPRPGPNASPYVGIDIEYKEFQADDNELYDISQHFREAFSYLDKVKRKGGVALVHCALGVNRSGAICLAYLMHAERMTLLEATRLIKSKRSLVLSNKGFQKRLVRFAHSKGLLDHGVESQTSLVERQEDDEGTSLRDNFSSWHLGFGNNFYHVPSRFSRDYDDEFRPSSSSLPLSSFSSSSRPLSASSSSAAASSYVTLPRGMPSSRPFSSSQAYSNEGFKPCFRQSRWRARSESSDVGVAKSAPKSADSDFLSSMYSTVLGRSVRTKFS